MLLNTCLHLLTWGVAPTTATQRDHAARRIVESVAQHWTKKWAKVETKAHDVKARINLQFMVRQQNTAALFESLESVSNPHSEHYGRHLSNEEVHALIAPKAEDVATVEEFVRAYGGSPIWATPNGDIVTAVVSVDTAEQMLSCSFAQLQHKHTGIVVSRIVDGHGYSLPDRVAAAVDFVAPTVHLPSVRVGGRFSETLQRIATRAFDSAAEYSNEPKTLRTLYNVGLNTTGLAPQNSMAVTAFLEQYFSSTDLKLYWATYCSDIVCGEEDGQMLPTLVGDATNGTPAGVESMLDIETITGIAGNVHAEFWGFAGRSADNAQNEPFMTWLGTVSNTTDEDVPKVFSTSYGEDEDSWSYSAATRLNVEFAKAGARGDEGANCEIGTFKPEAPASSPYVTAVGGTSPIAGFPNPGSEEAVGLSSGGFSNYWPMPSWQSDAVAEYLATDGLPSVSERGYNVSGRAVPDISMQAADFCVSPFGCSVAGTSCASPTAAGVIALLNDLRLQAGKSTLGFLNNFLYQNSDALFDVTTGSSRGCGVSEDGWPATSGWDAVTGLGTLNYEKLATAVLELP